MTYADREATLASDYEKLANDLPMALTAVTGDAWCVEIRRIDEGPRTGQFSGAHLKRADGFTVYMGTGSYNKPERAEFSISWPRSIDGSYRGYRDAPGVRYDAVSPAATASVTRSATAVAKQIARTLLDEPYVTAWRALLLRDEMLLASRDAGKVWRDAVAEAAGVAYREGRNGEIWWDRSFGEITSNRHHAGGSITLNLPDDPVKAAALVAKLREIMA